MSKARPALERFEAKVNKIDDKGGCWRWTGYAQESNRNKGTFYGKFYSSDGKRVLVHRWAYEQWVGPIPKGQQVHHTCHNSLCVNPEHLETSLETDHGVESANHRHGRTQKEEIPF